jgi:hypothetical protein
MARLAARDWRGRGRRLTTRGSSLSIAGVVSDNGRQKRVLYDMPDAFRGRPRKDLSVNWLRILWTW